MSSPRTWDRRALARLVALTTILSSCSVVATRARADDEVVRIAQADAPEPAPTPASEPEPAAESEPAESEPIEESSDIEVIHVKSEAYQDIADQIATSVTQFDAKALEALGAQNVADLAKVTPNLEIKTAGATAPTFFIRGVGLADFAANAAGAVAIYQDDVPMNSPALQLGSLFDLENVNVLRGPQGSGSGRNASAGAIRINSRKPTGELNAWLRSTFGNYKFKDFEGAIETPLVEGMLASRLAFRFTERDPIASNRCDEVPNRPPGTNTPLPAELIGDRVPHISERVATPESRELWRSVSVCGEARFSSFLNPEPPPDTYGLFFPGVPLLSPLPGNLEGDINDTHNWAARGQLLYEPPVEEMVWLFNAHGSKRDELSTLGQAVGTTQDRYGNSVAQAGAYRGRDVVEMENEIARELDPDNTQTPEVIRAINTRLANQLARNGDKHPYRGDYNRVGDTKLDIFGGAAKGEWSFPNVTFTSISGYDNWDRYRDTDQDFTPERLFEAITRDNAWQYSQELRAGGEFPDTLLRWDVGGFYLMEDLNSSTVQIARQITLPFPDTLLLDYSQKLYSWGAFAGFGWDFLDDFTLEGGVRWNWEQKVFDYSLKTSLIQSTTLLEENEIWQAPTGTLNLTYRFREDTSAYWKYSRGWKGGHMNALPQLTLGATIAEPETIDAFEMGVNGAWLDGRLGINTSLFYYDYNDYQVLVVQDSAAGPPGIAIINANDAQVYGAEVDARVEPIDALVATVRFGWLESEFLDFTNQVTREFLSTDGSVVTRVITVDYTGNQLINSPKLKVSGALEYTFELGGGLGALLPRYDFAWTDDVYFDPTEGRGQPNTQNQTFLPEFTTGQPAFWLHNIRLGYRTPDGNIEIAGWVRNLTNEVYKTYGFDASTFAKVVINYVGEPRTYGLDFIVHF